MQATATMKYLLGGGGGEEEEKGVVEHLQRMSDKPAISSGPCRLPSQVPRKRVGQRLVLVDRQTDG